MGRTTAGVLSTFPNPFSASFSSAPELTFGEGLLHVPANSAQWVLRAVGGGGAGRGGAHGHGHGAAASVSGRCMR